MTSMMVSVPHSPIMMVCAKSPKDEPEILRAFQDAQEAVHAYNPDLVYVFGTDHFSGFQFSLMPSYCIGTSCEAVDDVGGFPGKLNVDKDAAFSLVADLRKDGLEPALSRKMKVDHGFSQPMQRVLGGLDTYPCVPIFIAAITPPFISFKTSRLLGEAVGRHAKASGKKVLFLGSGGMSHHPTRYYPLEGEGEEGVGEYQLEGPAAGTFTEEEWLKRLLELHLVGAEMLVNGSRTVEDIRMNPEFDKKFMEIICSENPETLDNLDPNECFEIAGVGFMELHTWVAATTAQRACANARPEPVIYAPTLEYGIGFGMIQSARESGR